MLVKVMLIFKLNIFHNYSRQNTEANHGKNAANALYDY